MADVKTEQTKVDRLRDEYVKAVGAVEEAQAAIQRAQLAYDEACRRRNAAQAAFVDARIESDA